MNETLGWVLVLLALCPDAGRAAPPDHAGMVLVPAGIFISPFRRDTTALTISVSSFYLDAHAVTTAEYFAFLQRHPRFQPDRRSRLFADSTYLRAWKNDEPPADALNSPVTDVSWYAAKEYCSDQGKRLPTTAEWEWAAQPLQPDMDGDAFAQAIMAWYDTPTPNPLPPVGSGIKNVYGLRDLFGLIWEWTSDFNALGFTGINDQSAESRGLFCGAGTTHAAASADDAAYMRWAFRLSLKPDYTVESLGFRCARNAPSGG